ncbi:MAG: CPBP family intramembrane metalloprotease [Phycisphaerales bacterium]|nr:MAG: CPBP family intramembrane metalloprotease [Phycisphaerales bacterium]
MISRRRVSTVYVKELVDILRDRRTLAAMVVVPLVLYPLLMVGSVQALSAASPDVSRKPIVIGVDMQDVHWLEKLVIDDRLSRRGGALKPGRTSPSHEVGADSDAEHDTQADDEPEIFHRIVPQDEMAQAVRDRTIHVGVVRKEHDPVADRWVIDIFSDPEEVRSRSAAEWVRGLLGRLADRTVEWRVRQVGLPIEALNPIVIEEHRVSTPGSILSHILPLILVLMTITGAIYPAIDLTAGERERGTLETLMVCPVPVIDIIVGKFLVVATVAIVGAALNLASVSATVYFGGFEQALGSGEPTGGFPFGVLPIILVLLIPFAILFSAILIAVCSYARTFKEAQNYITPVILATLVPGGIAALPTSELQGVLTVMPVANMVLLTRELLLGSPVALGTVTWVLGSTTLYAAAAVAVAAHVFGAESVVFADSGSLKASFTRRTIKPAALPSAAMTILVVAILLPVWFFVQVNIPSGDPGSFIRTLRLSALAMPLCFIVVPLVVVVYWKIDVAVTFRLAVPSGRHVLAGVLLGLALWVPAAELSVLQSRLVGIPQTLRQADEALVAALQTTPWWQVVFCLGVVPGLCEEVCFRGFLLSGLGGAVRKWTAIIATACVFAVFHLHFFKLPMTAGLGIVLGYLCWQSRSIWPGVIAHVAHNSVSIVITAIPAVAARLGIDMTEPTAHLPAQIVVPGILLVVIGLALAGRQRDG